MPTFDLPPACRGLRRRIRDFVTWDRWACRSWSQEGEDRILARLFEHQSVGFYVDVGAHHPMRFSNTYLFYRMGWRGLNIDAMPGSMAEFRRLRGRDINLELGIGPGSATLDYYMFNEPALNGFSQSLSAARDGAASAYRLERVVKVEVRSLASVLAQHLPAGQGIDFMTVDVEGLDLDVLQSNDWQRYRPKFALVEVLESSLHDVTQGRIGAFMHEVGYAAYAKCVNTVFFKDRERAP